MTNNANDVDASGFMAHSDIDDLFGYANPNPERIGCPPLEELPRLARRDRSIDDPAYDHLAECSPCYRQVRGLQQAWARERASTWSTRGRWLVAAAVLLIAVGGTAWLQVRTRSTSRPPAETTSAEVAVATRHVELDLRRFTVSRGPQEQIEPTTVVLPQGWLTLTLLLPVGSEPGAYDVQLLNEASHAMASSPGQAAIRHFITTLETTIDVRGMRPGSYQLALRRPGEDWHLFPATVK